MIYTIGIKENYLRFYAEHKTEGLPFLKAGKESAGTDERFPNNYPGGSVWRTYAEAQEYLQVTDKIKTYAVFGVDADWGKDTEPAPNKRWHSLLKDSEIILLELYSD